MFSTSKVAAAVMSIWWFVWLLISQTEYNIFLSPSPQVFFQFIAFVLSFVVGSSYAYMLTLKLGLSLQNGGSGTLTASPQMSSLHSILYRVNLSCFGFLVLNLWISGAFGISFEEHFYRLRRGGELTQVLTFNKYTDAATKVIIWPIIYTSIVISLAVNSKIFDKIILISVLNIVLHCYLWQINYPFIHIFWIFLFFIISKRRLDRRKSVGKFFYVILFLVLLIQISSYRFGGDLIGGMKRYIYGYHLAGFSVYDYHYNLTQSVIHQHTFGLSSLGVFEQLFESLLRLLNIKYYAASAQNGDYLNDTVDIGIIETFQANAFGTFLFGLYRDFSLLGVLFGGFIYGAVTWRLSCLGLRDWRAMACFYVLASSWMMGMMVNPIEQPHFWLAILWIYLISFAIRIK